MMNKLQWAKPRLTRRAGTGNRTPAERLEISRSTIKLYPQFSGCPKPSPSALAFRNLTYKTFPAFEHLVLKEKPRKKSKQTAYFSLCNRHPYQNYAPEIFVLNRLCTQRRNVYSLCYVKHRHSTYSFLPLRQVADEATTIKLYPRLRISTALL